jgi:hypothetical protein
MLRHIPIALALALGLPAATMAQPFDRYYGPDNFANAPPGADLEQHLNAQRLRIEDGVRSGELDQGEAGDLWREAGKIWGRLQEARVDGIISPDEYRHIAEDLEDQDRRIGRQSRDGDRDRRVPPPRF